MKHSIFAHVLRNRMVVCDKDKTIDKNLLLSHIVGDGDVQQRKAG